MPRICESCGSEVLDRTVRVMYPDPDEIPICPHCDDVVGTRLADEIQKYYGNKEHFTE